MGTNGVRMRQRCIQETLEQRQLLAAPAAPVIIEPLTNGQLVSNFDVHMEIDPAAYFDADGHAHQSTTWQIKEPAAAGGATVWQALNVADPLSRNHIHLGDGTFTGTLAGQTALLPSHDYVLHVSFKDSNNETSATSQRSFTTTDEQVPVPGAGTWIVHEGYKMELAAPPEAFRLPVNIAFVPNPGPNPTDPLYYVTELYGSIKVVSRNGTVGTYATGLLDYNPAGPISGTGEQGLTGIAVDPATGDLFVGMLWNNGTTDAQRGGSWLHFPKVERLHSTDGGKTMATRTIILNMQPEIQGSSHQVSNISIGPDSKLYVHVGDGLLASTALNLDMFRGKVLRMNFDGTPVASGDPAGANPFYHPSSITARDYIYTYGHRNPFGGAWRLSNGKHWVVENGNAIDRMVDLTSGTSYGWNGSDTTIQANAKFIWDPATAPVNIAFIQPQTFGGSLFPTTSQNDAVVTLSGPTYAAGPQLDSKSVVWFPDMDTLNGSARLAVPPVTLVKYNGTGQASVSALAAGPGGLYFADLYRDDGVGGATAAGANIYRLRYADFQPSNVTITAGSGQVTLNWTNHAMSVVSNVYRSTGAGAPVLVASNVAGASYVDTAVVGGTHYHYIVRGVNTAGESNDSNEAHAIAVIPSTFNGAAGADSYYLKRSGANLDIWIGSNGIGAPTYTTIYTASPALTFNGAAGSDTITIDNSAGNAVPAAGISFDGGADPDTFNFIGAAASDSVTFNAASMIVSGMPVTFSNLETRVFDGKGGSDNLTINAGKVDLPATQFLAALSIANGATLDLRDHSLILDYSSASPIGSWTGSEYDGVAGLIQSGQNGGAWTGDGIITSMSNVGDGTMRTLGAGEASQVLGISGTETALWNGASVDSTAILVKYTYAGDIDLNGELNGDDYFYIDSYVLQSRFVFGYGVGDINLDGEINGDDYFLLDSNILAAQAVGAI